MFLPTAPGCGFYILQIVTCPVGEMIGFVSLCGTVSQVESLVIRSKPTSLHAAKTSTVVSRSGVCVVARSGWDFLGLSAEDTSSFRFERTLLLPSMEHNLFLTVEDVLANLVSASATSVTRRNTQAIRITGAADSPHRPLVAMDIAMPIGIIVSSPSKAMVPSSSHALLRLSALTPQDLCHVQRLLVKFLKGEVAVSSALDGIENVESLFEKCDCAVANLDLSLSKSPSQFWWHAGLSVLTLMDDLCASSMRPAHNLHHTET